MSNRLMSVLILQINKQTNKFRGHKFPTYLILGAKQGTNANNSRVVDKFAA